MSLLSFRIALRFMRGSWPRLAPAVIALACGVALTCSIEIVNQGILRAFVDVIDAMAGKAALQVTAPGGGVFPEELTEAAAAVSGVELAVPAVTAAAFVAGRSGELLTVLGVDITNDSVVRAYEPAAVLVAGSSQSRLDDPLVFLSQPDSVAITNAFAVRHRLRVGDSLLLDTPRGRRHFTVRGVLEPEGVARILGGNLIVMDIFAAEAVFTRPRFINRIDLVLSRNSELGAVQKGVAAVMPSGFLVEAPQQRKADLQKLMQSLAALLRAAFGLTGLVTAFLIGFNRLTNVFEQRTWQIGILRALGVRADVAWREMMKESLLLGATGVAIGLPLGIGLSYLMLPLVATAAAVSYNTIIADTSIGLGVGPLLVPALLGLGTAVLAAAIPARRVARLEPAVIILGRGIESPTGTPKFAGRTFALLVGCVVGALVMQHATGSATWGLLATALVAVALAAGARLVVHLGRSPLVSAFRLLAGPMWRFAAATVTRNPRRSALTVATIAVGIGAVFWLRFAAYSFERSVIEALTPAFRADLIAGSVHVESGVFETPVDQRLAVRLRRMNGVRAVAGERVREWPYRGGPVTIEAYDDAYYTTGDFGQWPLYGSSLADAWGMVARGTATVVSSSFVSNFGCRIGDVITLDTPGGPLSLRVAGVTVDFASPRGTLKISRRIYERLWHDRRVTYVFLMSSPLSSPALLRETIARKLGRRYGLRILSSRELVDYYADQVRRAFRGVNVLAGLILIIILVALADTLAGDVLERTRELGMLRAIGIAARHVRRMVVVEALLLALLGLALALVGGLSLGIIWVRATFRYLLGWMLSTHVPVMQLVAGIAATLLVSLVAALLTGRRAAALEPVTALRYE